MLYNYFVHIFCFYVLIILFFIRKQIPSFFYNFFYFLFKFIFYLSYSFYTRTSSFLNKSDLIKYFSIFLCNQKSREHQRWITTLMPSVNFGRLLLRLFLEREVIMSPFWHHINVVSACVWLKSSLPNNLFRQITRAIDVNIIWNAIKTLREFTGKEVSCAPVLRCIFGVIYDIIQVVGV